MSKLQQLREWWALAHSCRRSDPQLSFIWSLGYAHYELSGAFYTGEDAPLISVILYRLDLLTRKVKP